MPRRVLVMTLGLLLVAASARAQSFNLDAGTGPLPAATYGGAGQSPGVWQALDFAGGTTVTLTDADGAATAVTVTASAAFPSAAASDDGPSGDDEALLEDYLDLGAPEATFTIAGLAPGEYRVVTYAWTPGDASAVSYVMRVDDTWAVGGAWPGMLTDFTTHAVHDLELAAGEDVVIHITGVIGDGVLNGMQIVKLPDDPPPVGDPQGFNLDAGSEFGQPSRGYGAASGQEGVWMPIAFSAENPITLRGLDGEPTSVTVEANLPFGPAFYEHEGPSGDDEKLLEDYLDLHSTNGDFTFKGVPPGDYILYTYAWGPDVAAYRTKVTIGDDTQTIGGAWTGTLEEGVTHARHMLTVPANGRFVIRTFGTKGTLNGIQLVPVVDTPVEPEPEPTPEVAPEAEEPSAEVVEAVETAEVAETVEASPVDEGAAEAVEPAPEPPVEATSEPAAEAEVTVRGGADDGCAGGGPGGALLGVVVIAALMGVVARRRARSAPGR